MKRQHDPLAGIKQQLHEETAGTLGRAGKRLREAMQALRAFDARPSSRRSRAPLLHEAAEALWAYVIQKELIGSSDDALITAVFGVTPEVWRQLGALSPQAESRCSSP